MFGFSMLVITAKSKNLLTTNSVVLLRTISRQYCVLPSAVLISIVRCGIQFLHGKIWGCRMFRPITGSAHGPNHPTGQPVNREVFSRASGRREPKRLTNSSLVSTVCMS